MRIPTSLSLALLLSIVFYSCESHHDNYLRVCKCSDYEKITEFVQGSILNANNMSDEEMEDVIRELEQTGIRNYCGGRNVKFTSKYGKKGRVLSRLDSCETVEFIR